MKKHLKKLLSITLAALIVFGGTTGVGLLKNTAIKAEAVEYSGSSYYMNSKYYTALKNVTLTGNQREDIVNIAMSQLGYHEGDSNADLGGGNTSGSNDYNEYSYHIANGKAQAWCGNFVAWCAQQANISTDIIANNYVQFVPNAAHYTYYSASSYTPSKGDLFIEGDWAHIGIVAEVNGNTIKTIEGNADRAVSSYSRTSSRFTYFIVPNYSSSTPVNPPHSHSYTSSVTAPTCTEQGYTTHTCECGDSYKDTYVNALGHDYIKTITSSPDCTKEGEASYKCSRCPASYTEPIAALGHDEGVWKLDYEATLDHDGQLSRYCLRCGAYIESKPIAKHEHTLGEAEIIRPATCTEEGLEARICSVCGMCAEIESFSAKGHCEKPAEVTTIAPTCTEKGEKAFYCTDCGLVLYTEEVSALGHNDEIWTTDKAATCTEDGEMLGYCSRCGELTGSETVPAKGHSNESIKIVTTPATCTVSGEAELRCTDCGTVVGTEKLNALGHDDGVWSVSVAPTCELDGEEICTCTRCGEKIDSREANALGHDSGVWKIDFEATADHDGQMTKYCSRCNMTLGETKTFALHTHTEGYRATIIAPECEKEGMGGIFCATCGVQYGTYSIAELSHNYSDWHMNNDGTHAKSCSRCHDVQILNCRYEKTVTAPTCLDFGYTTYVCKDCGYMYTDNYIEPLGHDLSEWVADDECTHSRACCRENCDYTECEEHEMTDWMYNADGTICHNGTKTRFCPVCGYEETEEAQHSNFFGKIIHTVWIWFLNVIFKIDYIIGLNWLFPWMNIYPQM